MSNPDLIPENMIDMITYELYEDPVIAEDNFVYSRSSIMDWFEGCQESGESITSPLTGTRMGTTLRPDPQMERNVSAFKARGQKSQRANESTQTIGTLAKIFEIIDPLRELFATKNWQAPALVVMGNENSGKSTLLERLAMMPIFPKDKFICTRMAIRVHLRRGPSMAPRLDVFDKQTGTVMWSKVVPMEKGREYVKEAMDNVLIQEFGGLTGVSKTKMLILHITGPNCPDLDMVDLPGLVSTHVRGEPDNMRALTADLVESYVRENNSHSLYLVAVPATSAPNQSLAFEVVQKMGLHDRSIGVFTKSDKCDLKDESDGIGGLANLRLKVNQQSRDTVPLEQWGYICTVNKPQDTTNKSNYSSLINQSKEEVDFFAQRGMQDLIDTHMAGCKALLLRISIMFHEYLRSTWAPSTILLLREETKDYRQRERLLGHPRADAFRPASTPPQSGPDALHTKDEIIKLAMGRATEMFEEATSDIMGVMTEEVLQHVFEAVKSESCEVCGKPSEVLAHQLNLKHSVSSTILDALDSVERIVITMVSGAMTSDESTFKLGRFPHFIEALSQMFVRQLAPWKAKTEAALMSYVNVAFQSPLTNPYFKLKYEFNRDEDGQLQPTVEMDFDAEPLAATLVHTIILRCSILLTETISMGDDVKSMLHSINWVESCASEREFFLKGLLNVDKVVSQLSDHLNLTEADIESFARTGAVLPQDSIQTVKAALAKASLINRSSGGSSSSSRPQPTVASSYKPPGGQAATTYPSRTQQMQPTAFPAPPRGGGAYVAPAGQYAPPVSASSFVPPVVVKSAYVPPSTVSGAYVPPPAAGHKAYAPPSQSSYQPPTQRG